MRAAGTDALEPVPDHGGQLTDAAGGVFRLSQDQDHRRVQLMVRGGDQADVIGLENTAALARSQPATRRSPPHRGLRPGARALRGEADLAQQVRGGAQRVPGIVKNSQL